MEGDMGTYGILGKYFVPEPPKYAKVLGHIGII